MGLLKRLQDLRSRSEEEGFTLIELVIVVAIIGILSAIAIPTFGSIQENTRHASGQTTAKNTYAALATVASGVSDLTASEILANANNKEVSVTTNSWTSESDLCVTVTWKATPTSVQDWGPGCL